MKNLYKIGLVLCVPVFFFFAVGNSLYAQNDPVVVTIENPYNEGFEATGLGNWATEAITGNDVWVQTADASHTGTQCANYSSSLFGDFLSIDPNDPMSYLQLMSMMTQLDNIGNGSARFTSPILDLSNAGGQVSLSFYRKHTSLMIPQTLELYYRTSPVSQWVLLQQYTTSNDWTQEIVVLPSLSATYQISFVGIFDVENMGEIDIMSFLDANASMNYASNIYIDDIFIGVSTPCNPPQNLTVASVDTNSATVTWNGTATSWTVEFGPAGFSQGNGTIYTAQNTTYTFTGLTANTSYDVYVRANCDEDITSSWAHTEFTTTTPTPPVVDGISENGTGYLTVSPNPTTGIVRCNLTNIGNTRLQVLDVYGKLLMEKEVTEQVTELDFTDKASVVYFLRVINDNKIVTTRKVIRR